MRCVTLYAITLYRPIAASTSAKPPNTANIVAPIFHERICGAMIVDIGVTVTYETPGMSG